MDTQEFKWNDTSIKELIHSIFDNYTDGMKLDEIIRQFKQSKEPVQNYYEILSFISILGDVFNKNRDWSFGVGGTYGENACLNLGLKIHSVRRLSDNEIFTIGDTLFFTETAKHAITSFTLNKKGEIIVDCARAAYDLDLINKQPKYNWLVFTINQFNQKAWVLYDFNKQKYSFTDGDYYRLFITQQEAKDFIIENKPCISINEIQDHLLRQADIDELKERTRRKLNL